MRAPIGTTIVSALVRGNDLAVAWVGDSRAYFITDRGEEQLTTDHSEGRVLTSCLGMIDVDGRAAPVEPAVVSRTIGKSGALVLCSDGLWNYFPTASALAHLTHSMHNTPKNSAILARFLVNSALAAGGADNVSVAVHLR
jgi:PPM family protein phosphatase